MYNGSLWVQAPGLGPWEAQAPDGLNELLELQKSNQIPGLGPGPSLSLRPVEYWICLKETNSDVCMYTKVPFILLVLSVELVPIKILSGLERYLNNWSYGTAE